MENRVVHKLRRLLGTVCADELEMLHVYGRKEIQRKLLKLWKALHNRVG